jgi:hypothetical protein
VEVVARAKEQGDPPFTAALFAGLAADVPSARPFAGAYARAVPVGTSIRGQVLQRFAGRVSNTCARWVQAQNLALSDSGRQGQLEPARVRVQPSTL